MAEAEVVVIGAGAGGLAAALDLVAAGRSVTVVERSDRPGGKVRELEVGGARIDSGPTVLTMKWVFDELFAAAGARFDERVAVTRAEVLARHAWSESERLDLFADPERTADAIGDFAGARAAAGFRGFCDRARAVYTTLERAFLRGQRPTPLGLTVRAGGLVPMLAVRPFSTLWRELGGFFADPRLRQLFGRYATYCGSSPFLAPATLMLVAHVELAGVWQVAGGMQRLPEAMARLVRQNQQSARLQWREFTIDLMATPAGLLDLAPPGTRADLLLTVEEVSPLGLIGKTLAGEKPSVRIEGDVQLAAEVNWLVDHVRWDIEEDMSRVLGDVVAHRLASIGREASKALKLFAQNGFKRKPTA